MATIKNQFQRIKTVEVSINKHLFIICSVVTLVVMVMVIAEFFTRGSFLSSQISLFYLGVLILYSLHKEIVRWLGHRKAERQGEYFVYSWVSLTTILYIVNFATKNYYSVNSEGLSIDILQRISILTLEVLAIFVFTRLLKILKVCLIRGQFLKKIKEND